MNKYLTPSSVLNFIERKLGFGFNLLELNPDDILETIRMETLPTFSKYYPLMIDHMINPKEDIVNGYKNRYYLKCENYQIMGVAEVFISDSYSSDFIGMGFTSNIGSNGSEAQMIQDLISANRVPVTHRYYDYDNTVSIFPGGLTSVGILSRLKVVHSEDFSTIPLNMRDEFLKLALYDVQESLLPLRRRFSNLNTAYGNIELFISDLEEASSKKEELFEKWRRNFIKAPNRKKIYIY